MHDDYIELTDFAGSKYRIDYNDKTIAIKVNRNGKAHSGDS